MIALIYISPNSDTNPIFQSQILRPTPPSFPRMYLACNNAYMYHIVYIVRSFFE